MQMTLRSGHATAAPTATGPPKPIEPPMLFSQSCGGAPALNGKKPRPVVTNSSTTIAPSGIVAPSAWPRPSSVNLPVGRSGRCGLGDARGLLVQRAELGRQRLERAQRIAVDRAERRHLAAVRRPAPTACRDRRRRRTAPWRRTSTICLVPFSTEPARLDHEVQAQHRHAAGAALDARRAAGRLHLAAGLGGDLAGQLQARGRAAPGRR